MQSIRRLDTTANELFLYNYSKEPKTVPTFNLFTIFPAELIQSEDNCKPFSAFD